MARDPAKALRRLGSHFRPTDAELVGLEYQQLQALVQSGRVERIGWGLYRRPDVEATEHHSLAAVCARVPNSVVCLLSALQVHGIGTSVPAEVWLAVPNKARPPRVASIRLRLLRFSGPAWDQGVKAIRFEGVPARITDPARTVVDCFRFQRLVGLDVAREALVDALGQRLVTVDALDEVLDVLPSTRLRATLESML